MFRLVRRHSRYEIESMESLVEESIKQYYIIMDFKDVEQKAREVTSKYRKKIEEILNKPMGGTFAPEEIAEIIIYQDMNKNRNIEEAAATSSYF